MTRRNKRIGALLGAIIIIGVLWAVWANMFAPTKVAFVNWQAISLGEVSKANDNSYIKISELSTDQLSRLDRFDMVFINAMGIRLTEEQRSEIEEAAAKGINIMTTAATNPANLIISVDSVSEDILRKYISNGGRRNYRSMLNYVRKYVDGKCVSIGEICEAEIRSSHMLYHKDPEDMDGEELGFNSVADYERFLVLKGLWKEEAPHIIVTGMMGEPTDLISRLEETGNVVYPVRQIQSFVKNNHIDSISPSAIINMAHGRMGDYMVEYLEKRNIPLFAPLYVNRLVDEWEADNMGMSGGFLSQSVVTPEIDGAIRPQVLFGNYLDDEGLQHAKAIEDRLERFVEAVNNHVTLQRKPNKDKKIAIYYYKGPGQSSLASAGMEVGPSLYNLLKRLRDEGYKVEGLPSDSEGLIKLIQEYGSVFNPYAEGAVESFVEKGSPALVSKDEYVSWSSSALSQKSQDEVEKLYGDFPGSYMYSGDGKIIVARIELGNIVLLPQPMAGIGDDSFKIIHGTDQAPPYSYIASYLWTRYGFGADAIIHFGTHGSLEFTPRKQAALSHDDWPDALIGPLPHFYVYSIGDVGEGVIAKRRSYAALQSHLTPPFMESGLRDTYKKLTEAIKTYNSLYDGSLNPDSEAINKASLEVKRIALDMGINRALALDSIPGKPWSASDIQRIEQYGEEVANEKIMGKLYVMGEPYEKDRIISSVYAMTTDPIAYSLLALDKLRGKADPQLEKHAQLFSDKYMSKAKVIVTNLLNNPSLASDAYICRVAGITQEELDYAREIDSQAGKPINMMEIMTKLAEEAPAEAKTHADISSTVQGANDSHGGHLGMSLMPEAMRKKMMEKAKDMSPEEALAMARKMGASDDALKKMEAKMKEKASQDSAGSSAKTPDSEGGMAAMIKAFMGKKDYPQEDITKARAIMEVERAIGNVANYKSLLSSSPQSELASIINALNGGFTSPSPGGDVIANPNTLPTGRNLFAINAEETPTEEAWEKGKKLAESTLKMYKERHNDSLPRKVSYTLWSGEFIESGGATVAQVLYMLGVEPIRDSFGRVADIRLIPSEELGRPRIDVVVQTSGQLRDIAASRLFLINRAVEMAAKSDDKYDNQVAQGIVEAEKVLMEKGLTPKEARKVSFYRVFGGLNGGYGTGIQDMVNAGDRWENETEIADVYLNNMGAFYGSEDEWEQVMDYAFEAALSRTDAVVQPRQSNTWGALSLDHVYEFMGGLNLAVRNVTGKEPDAYLSDYRNRNNARMQEVKEAIGVESSATLFNPNYIKEKMKGGASSASAITDMVRNTYGWNVMKPAAIDNEMWNEIYDVYVKDKHNLDIKSFFTSKSPADLEEITAVMMESARKGMWKASDSQLKDVAQLHAETVNKYKPSCSQFVCDNAKLRQFIASKIGQKEAKEYNGNIDQIRKSSGGSNEIVMKKNDDIPQASPMILSNFIVIIILVAAILLIFAVIIRHRRKH